MVPPPASSARARRPGSPPARPTACASPPSTGSGIMMAPQRQPISRLQGQMRLFDAICEDLGVAATAGADHARDAGSRRARRRRAGSPSLSGRYHVAQWNLHQNAAPTVDGFTELRAAAHGLRHLPRGADLPGHHRRSRALRRAAPRSTRRWAPTRSSRTSTGSAAAEHPARPIELFAERVHAALRGRPAARDAAAPGSPRPGPHDLREPAAHRRRRACGRTGSPGKLDEWLGQFEPPSATAGAGGATSSTSPPRRRCGPTPTASVDIQGLLRLISDIGCPDCGRPVIALYRRRDGEDRAAITAPSDGAHAGAPVARAAHEPAPIRS